MTDLISQMAGFSTNINIINKLCNAYTNHSDRKIAPFSWGKTVIPTFQWIIIETKLTLWTCYRIFVYKSVIRLTY